MNEKNPGFEPIQKPPSLGARLAYNSESKGKVFAEKLDKQRQEVKSRLKEYRDTMIAFGKLKPNQQLTRKEVGEILESLGYKQKDFAKKIIAAWGPQTEVKDFIELMNEPDFWK